MARKKAQQPPADSSKEQRRSLGASRRRSPVKPPKVAAPKQPATAPQQGRTDTRGTDGLTDQQRQFYRAYKLHRNGTQAAIEAGYSAATSQQQASRLLKHVNIRRLLERDAEEERALHEQKVVAVRAEMNITAERVLREWARIAFFDVRRMADADGNPIPLHQLDDDTAAAIAGLDVQELWAGEGDDRRVIGHVKKWKLSAKDKALDALSKHLNLYAADNTGKQSTLAEALAGFVGQIHSTGSRLPIRAPRPAP